MTFQSWVHRSMLQNFEKSSNMAKNEEKCIVQFSFNPFIGWFWLPENRILDTCSATRQWWLADVLGGLFYFNIFFFLENNRAVDDWESDSDSDISDTSDSLVRPDSNCISTPQQRKNREFDGNISRKQGHVIIPLRCSEVLNLGQDHSGSSPRISPLADSFFQQLSSIQTETRRQLLEAKSVGT